MSASTRRSRAASGHELRRRRASSSVLRAPSRVARSSLRTWTSGHSNRPASPARSSAADRQTRLRVSASPSASCREVSPVPPTCRVCLRRRGPWMKRPSSSLECSGIPRAMRTSRRSRSCSAHAGSTRHGGGGGGGGGTRIQRPSRSGARRVRAGPGHGCRRRAGARSRAPRAVDSADDAGKARRGRACGSRARVPYAVSLTDIADRASNVG